MESNNNMPELVIVSGMSGAGRTEAMHVFEDLNYFCVDNLPPDLIDDLLSMPDFSESTDDSRKIAIVCDARGRGFFASMSNALSNLAKSGISYKIVFLDASDDKLISRYKSSRRMHPLCKDGASISAGIERERSLLRELRTKADFVIDTTNLLPAATVPSPSAPA